MKVWSGIIVTIALFLSICMCSIPVQAASGIAISPGSFTVDSAMRGSTYQNTLYIINSGDQPTDYTASTAGEAGTWVSLYYNGQPFTKVSLEPDAQAICQAQIAVPSDAVNGQHNAMIVVTSIPVALKSGSGLALSAQALITINVTGTQVISGTVDSITTKDTELGSPLRIQVYLKNTGNVEVTPQINADITYNGKLVQRVSYDKTKVSSGQRQPVTLEWDTTGNAPADYNAHVTVSLDGKTTLAEQDLSFKILPLGSLSRSGTLQQLTLQGKAVANLISKVDAIFVNTGQMDVLAQFTGEVYFNGNLIQNIQSDKMLVYGGMQVDLPAYFMPTQAGNYTIKGYVTYEGKVTETKDLAIKVNTIQENQASGSTMTTLTIIFAVLAIVAMIVAVVLIRNRKKT